MMGGRRKRPLLSLEHIHLYLPNRVLLEDVTLRLLPSERVGLVGENGSGKSTLMRVAAGLEDPSEGRITRDRGMVLGYLPQSGLSHRGRSLWEEVLTALPEWLEAVEAKRRLLEKISTLPPETPEHERVMRRYGELETLFEQEGGYARESRLKKILEGLGFSPGDLDRPVEAFSAGWQMRIGLAKVLAREPDFMLLDEPTDHLDLEAKNWLEEYLKGSKAGLLLVSHDRHFLDTVVQKIVEISNAKLEVYAGNYAEYIKEKEKREARKAALYAAQQAEIQRLEDFIARNRVRKDRARQAQSRMRRLERIERVEGVRGGGGIRFSIRVPPRAPRILVELIGVDKSFPGRELFNGLSLRVEREEKIAVVGANGAGKSTLLRILSGRERIERGIRQVGDGISIGFYAHHGTGQVGQDETILESILGAFPSLSQGEARGLLAQFRFRGEEVFKPVQALSGGEAARLRLARIFPKRHHLLLLDEPTNHLDILTRQALLEALQAYGGTVVFVSHDRYFIQEIATRVVEIQEGRLLDFPGRYEEFLEWKASSGALLPGGGAVPGAVGGDASAEEEKKERIERRAARKREQRRVQRRRRRIEQLEVEISRMEAELEGLEREMALPEYAADHLRLEELHRRVLAIREDLEKAYGEWDALLGEEGASA